MCRRVLLTGVSGFVGGALGVHLRKLGHHVVGVSRSAPRPGACSTHLTHDLAQSLPADWPPVDVVVHCAALSSPWASPASYRANNVDATSHMLAYAERAGARHFVFISSSSVYYQHGDQFDLTEEAPLPSVAINEYAATKRQGEEMVRRSETAWTILRPRAVFGPGDTVLFPRILRAAKRGQLPRMVRPDGRSPRADLIYIENLSYYVGRAIAQQTQGVLNLTNNEPVDLYPFLDGLLEKMGIPKPRRAVNVRTAMLFAGLAELGSQYLMNYREPPVTRFGVEVMAYSKTLDVSKMLAMFGPPPVSIDAGVEQFIAWYRRQ